MKEYLTYHCSSHKLLKYASVDTCITAVFYVNDAESFRELIEGLKMFAKEPSTLIQVCSKTPSDTFLDDDLLIENI